ncbi:MAG: heme-binding protein, partial [Thiobacillus sp.]|nr:heme-binding protein [Thiobacillus sp.]
MKKTMWWTIVGITILGGALWGPIVSNVEQAKYSVVEKNNNIEIRDYAPMIVAETEVAGAREKAISEGFR